MYPGYLINQNEIGIGMIPLEPAVFTTQYPINKMKVVDNVYIFISQENIKNVKVKKNPLCLKQSIRFITIETKNGEIFHFRVSKKDKFLSYQENNFLNFVKKYGKIK